MKIRINQWSNSMLLTPNLRASLYLDKLLPLLPSTVSWLNSLTSKACGCFQGFQNILNKLTEFLRPLLSNQKANISPSEVKSTKSNQTKTSSSKFASVCTSRTSSSPDKTNDFRRNSKASLNEKNKSSLKSSNTLSIFSVSGILPLPNSMNKTTLTPEITSYQTKTAAQTPSWTPTTWLTKENSRIKILNQPKTPACNKNKKHSLFQSTPKTKRKSCSLSLNKSKNPIMKSFFWPIIRRQPSLIPKYPPKTLSTSKSTTNSLAIVSSCKCCSSLYKATIWQKSLRGFLCWST